MAISDWRKLARDEFGLDLFDCISKFSERDWIRRTLHRMQTHELKTATCLQLGVCTKQRLQQYDAQLTQEIMALIPKLQPEDVKRLLDQYEAKGAA